MTTSATQFGAILQKISVDAVNLYRRVLEAPCLSICGDTLPEEIAAATDLEHYGFVFRRPTATGYGLVPTPVEILIPSLLHRLDWGYPPFAEYSDSDQELMRSELIRLREESPKSEWLPLESPGMPRTIEGAAEIDAFVARILPDTQEVCAISAAEWSANLPLVWAVLEKRLKEGMRYRRIVSPLGLAAFGWEINDRDIRETGVDLRVSLTPTMSPFYVYVAQNQRSALVFVPPAHAKAEPRATYTALGQLTDRLWAMFSDQWEAAAPARGVLDELRTHRSGFVAKAHHICGAAGAHVAGSLFDKGVFSSFSIDEQALMPSLVESGLVVHSKFTIGLTAYIPNIMQQISRSIRQESQSNDTSTLRSLPISYIR